MSGEWIGNLSGLGAGLDSFYEYLLKSYIMFGETEDYAMFHEAYQNIKQHLRRGYVLARARIASRPYNSFPFKFTSLSVSISMANAMYRRPTIHTLLFCQFHGTSMFNSSLLYQCFI